MDHRKKPPTGPPAPPPNPLFDDAPPPKPAHREPGEDLEDLVNRRMTPYQKPQLPISHPDAAPPPVAVSREIQQDAPVRSREIQQDAPAPSREIQQDAPKPQVMTAPAKTQIARKTFEGQEVEIRSESQAVAEQAKALVAARFLVAERRPRDVDEARVRILGECKRPGFAQVAEYAKPQGDKTVRGPSIRFAEAALRLFGNIVVDSIAVYDDEEKRVCRVSITDLETNTTFGKDVTIRKEVERKNVRRGQQVLGERVNTKGEVVFLVRASDDELLQKESSLVSKTLRTQGLRLIPGDIVAEGLALAKATRANSAAADPDAGRKQIADGFAELNVLPSDLKDYLGCDLGQASPAQLDELRAVWVGIKEGDVSWKEVMEARTAEVAAEAEKPKASAAAKSRLDHLKQDLAKRRGEPAGG